MDQAFAAALGKQWAGQFTIAKPLKVAYCTSEGRGGIPQRIRAAAQWYGIAKSPEALEMVRQNLFISFDVPQLFNRQAKTFVTRFIDDYTSQCGNDLDLLYIDTQHNATIGGNENDARDAGHVVEATKMVRDALGCAIILGHHANRAGTGYRGSSAYEGDMDTILECTGAKNPRKLKSSKVKDGVTFDPLEYLIEADEESAHIYWNGPVGETGTHADELIEEMESREGMRLTAKQWGDAIRVTQKEALGVFASLVKTGKVRRDLQNPDKNKSRITPGFFGSNHNFSSFSFFILIPHSKECVCGMNEDYGSFWQNDNRMRME